MIEAAVETLDVRDMAPRERHPAIFARLDTLKPGQSLRLLNDHNPAPLHYQLLAERPRLFTWEPEMQGPETWIVCIRRSGAQEQTPVSSTQETSSKGKGSKTILPTQPLRDEHQELLPQIAVLRTVADSIGTAKDASLRQGVQEVSQFLTLHLLPQRLRVNRCCLWKRFSSDDG